MNYYGTGIIRKLVSFSYGNLYDVPVSYNISYRYPGNVYTEIKPLSSGKYHFLVFNGFCWIRIRV